VRGLTAKAVGIAVVVATIGVGESGAQILRRAPSRPTPPNWIGGGVSIMQPYTLRDGITNSQWSFDSDVGYTLTFEHPTASGILLGLQGVYGTPSLVYTSSSPGAVDCSGGCDATATVMQIMGLAHSANSYGFHGAYQLTAGVTGFSSFKDRTTNTKIGPMATDYDFSIAVGYGLGFGISPTTSIELIQEIGTLLHQRTGLAAGTGNYPRMSATRLMGKLAF
jgi:hypothetical protein